MELKLSEHFTYKKLILYVLPCVAMMILTSVLLTDSSYQIMPARMHLQQ